MTKKQPIEKQGENKPGAKELADVLKLAYQARYGLAEIPEHVGRQIDAGTQAAYNLAELVRETDPKAYNAIAAIAIAKTADDLKLGGQARDYASQLAASYAQKAGLEQMVAPADKPPSAAPGPQSPAYASIEGFLHRLVGGQGLYGQK